MSGSVIEATNLVPSLHYNYVAGLLALIGILVNALTCELVRCKPREINK
jgi:hypothetical protein